MGHDVYMIHHRLKHLSKALPSPLTLDLTWGLGCLLGLLCVSPIPYTWAISAHSLRLFSNLANYLQCKETIEDGTSDILQLIVIMCWKILYGFHFCYKKRIIGCKNKDLEHGWATEHTAMESCWVQKSRPRCLERPHESSCWLSSMQELGICST